MHELIVTSFENLCSETFVFIGFLWPDVLKEYNISYGCGSVSYIFCVLSVCVVPVSSIVIVGEV